MPNDWNMNVPLNVNTTKTENTNISKLSAKNHRAIVCSVCTRRLSNYVLTRPAVVYFYSMSTVIFFRPVSRKTLNVTRTRLISCLIYTINNNQSRWTWYILMVRFCLIIVQYNIIDCEYISRGYMTLIDKDYTVSVSVYLLLSTKYMIKS